MLETGDQEHILLCPSHRPLANTITTEPGLDSPSVALSRLISAHAPISHTHQVQYGPDTADHEAHGEADQLSAGQHELVDTHCCC